MNARFHDPQRAQRELLSGSQLLGGLPPAVLDSLIGASRLVELAANESLYAAGAPIREAYILFSGTVKRVAQMPGGALRVVELLQTEQLLSPGEIFGASHYLSSCTSIKLSLLVAIDLRRLREAMQSSHELSHRIITALARHQCATEFDATVYHYGLTGTQRLLDYLLELAGDRSSLAGETTVTLKASKKVIAARIGMTPESLSRNLRELSDQGVIVVDGRYIHIQNAAVLDTTGGQQRQRLNFQRKRKGDGADPAKPPTAGALVNMCGRLRVLSQRLALAWGSLVSGIGPARARINMRQYEKEFIRNLDRLERFALEPALKTHLSALKAVWPDYLDALCREDAEHAEHIFNLSEKILELADGLTAEASHSSGLPQAHYVNTAGRNRMLSQRIGKFFLFRDWGQLHIAVASLSPPCCEEFESNLKVLASVGRGHPEIEAQLEVVTQQWQRFVRSLCPDLSYSGKVKHSRLVLAEGERLLRSVDTTVKLFERLSQ